MWGGMRGRLGDGHIREYDRPSSLAFTPSDSYGQKAAQTKRLI